jgi:AcrR family transcriptional regulator
MARKPSTHPRKHAAQARSRATVDALVEATARILVREGYDKASTNRIAEVAGVGIGSLYQYFPGKEALVAAVIDRHNETTMRLVRATLAEVAPLPLAQAVRRLVAMAIQAHRIDPRLHRVLAEQIPRTGRLENVESFNREAHAGFRAYLEAHRDELRMADLDLATYMCANTIEAISHNAVLHGPTKLTDEAAAVLVEETTRMVVGYLQ